MYLRGGRKSRTDIWLRHVPDPQMEHDVAADANRTDSKPPFGALKTGGGSGQGDVKARQRNRRKFNDVEDDPSKRRCVSTACIACRYVNLGDGNTPLVIKAVPSKVGITIKLTYSICR